MRNNIKIFLSFLLIAFVIVPLSAKKSKKQISEKELFKFASDVARSGVYSKMPQIDILRQMFYKYKPKIKIKNTYFITGKDFNKAYTRSIPRFTKLKDQLLQKKQIKSRIKVPKIKYNNFKKIILKKEKKHYKIKLDLKKTYVQELPFTWGAKVKFIRGQNAIIRASGDSILEMIFPKNLRPEFFSPPIAFFIPDINIHMTSLRIVKGEVIGYVIGTNLSDKRKRKNKTVYAIEFNLSTCSKSSITKYKLNPKEYKKKKRNIRYFGFID